MKGDAVCRDTAWCDAAQHDEARRDAPPLQGMLVLDFGQFLSAPSASLRLADLGARVIKIERPPHGDICRTLYISNLELDGDSTLFHAINRNKESFAADLRNADDVRDIHKLIRQADVLIQNFRPGVMARLGLEAASVLEMNPAIVYAEISGYGDAVVWRDKPGQDLLVQARSGLVWGNRRGKPSPAGLSMTDMSAGEQLVEGILACLVRRGMTGKGGHVEVSLLESALDAEKVRLTEMLNCADGIEGVHATTEGTVMSDDRLSGIYATKDGYMALGDTTKLEWKQLIQDMDGSIEHAGEETKAREILFRFLSQCTNAEVRSWLDERHFPNQPVWNWNDLIDHGVPERLEMIQETTRQGTARLITTCCPIRIDGKRPVSSQGAPRVGEHTETIQAALTDDQDPKTDRILRQNNVK